MPLMDYDSQTIGLAREILHQAGRGYTPEQLQALPQIIDTKRKYWWCVDLQQWDLLAEVFTDDLQYFCNGYGGAISPQDQAARAALACPETIIPLHMGHNMIVSFTGPASARLLVSLHDHHTAKSDYSLKDGWGLYIDDFVKGRDGRWRIAILRLAYRKLEGDRPIPPPR